MAVTSIWKVEGRLARVLGYAENAEKTEGQPDEWERQGVGAAILYAADPGKTESQRYVTGINCLPETALAEMNATKRQYGKAGGIVAFHGYQAFAPGEADPEAAHEIGVALARELWGERFEVVVATHLDKAHLHNHFVINSVSFADGRRFHRDASCYRAMRDASDRLCRERGLSVVDNPTPGRSKHHAEWRAELEGRPTWRSLVKADADEAIARAATMRQFYANLRAMGYEIKTGKDISVRPPGKERFVRLRRNFGDGYSYGGIAERILRSERPGMPVNRPKSADAIALPPVPPGSLVSLYRRYMAMFNASKRRGPSGARIHFLLREDLRNFDTIAQEMALLVREGIETERQVLDYAKALGEQAEALERERRSLRNGARRAREAGGAKAVQSERIKEISADLKRIRKDLSLCRGICDRGKALAQRISKIEHDERARTEEKEKAHGRIERSR